MRIKVLIVLGKIAIGGAERMVYELVRSVDRSAIDISVLCYQGRQHTALEYDIEKLCNVIYMSEKGHIGISTIRRVIREIDRLHPDIIHAHLGGTIFSVIWSLLRHKPSIITAHTKPEKAFSPKIVPAIKLCVKKGYTRIVSVSESNKKAMQLYFGFNDEECLCVNNGINISKFYTIPHEEFTYINVGRQDENKNQAVILKCFSRIHAQLSPPGYN